MALLPHHGRATRHSLTASHVTPHEAISPRRWRRVAAGVAKCDRVRTVEVTIWTTTTTTTTTMTMFSVSLQLMTWENINPGNCILCLLCSIAAPQNRCMKTWRHPQNRKYITYRNASRGEPSQGQFFSKVAANSVIAISQLERYAISSDVSNSLRWASI